MYEKHTCPNCKEEVNLRLSGRELKTYEWCLDCKEAHADADWVVRWFNHRFGLWNRKDIIIRDGAICYICEDEINPATDRLTIDHVVPTARGGFSVPSNLRVCCEPCNNRKGDLLLEELEDETE